MSNVELVNTFVEVLLRNPEMTMQAVALRLSATDYELKLLQADPCRRHYNKHQETFEWNPPPEMMHA